MLSVGKASVLNQVLRQCNFRREPVNKRNFETALSKQKAIVSLKHSIRDYQNLSTVTQEPDPNMVNMSGDIPQSYLSKSRKQNQTLDPARVSHEVNSVIDSQYNSQIKSINNSSILRNYNQDFQAKNGLISKNDLSVKNASQVLESGLTTINNPTGLHSGVRSPYDEQRDENDSNVLIGNTDSRTSLPN